MPDKGTQTRPNKFKRFLARLREVTPVVEFIEGVLGIVAVIIALLIVLPFTTLLFERNG